MPKRVPDLRAFRDEMIRLLQIVSNSREVLFRLGFRQNIQAAIEEAIAHMTDHLNDESLHEAKEENVRNAGLVGNQLELKLESFESALVYFEYEGGQARLEEVLDKGKIILGSLAGAIPGFGSLVQELVEFLLKELRKH
jgi:hypothetical protein